MASIMASATRVPGADPRRAGTSLTELLVCAGLVGVVVAASIPLFHSHLHGSALKAGAEELAGLLNLARSLAIKENTRVCVTRDPGGSSRVRILIGGPSPCAAGENFYGARGRGFDHRVDAGGWITFANDVRVTAATADVVFTPLGAAVPGGSYTVSRHGRTLTVVVAPSGRVNVAP
jgi:Tfp pilus assembly protein FimT